MPAAMKHVQKPQLKLMSRNKFALYCSYHMVKVGMCINLPTEKPSELHLNNKRMKHTLIHSLQFVHQGGNESMIVLDLSTYIEY